MTTHKKKTDIFQTNDRRRILADPLKAPLTNSNRLVRFDNKERMALIKAAKLATAAARRKINALDLPVTFIQKGVVYRRAADGKITIIVPANTAAEILKRASVLKKGMILHAKK